MLQADVSAYKTVAKENNMHFTVLYFCII